MSIPFVDLALSLEGPRRSGRSVRILSMADTGSTILCINQQHIEEMQHIARSLSRSDLKFAVLNRKEDIAGRHGDIFQPDHRTVSYWLYEAHMEIGHWRKQFAECEKELRKAKTALRQSRLLK